MTTTEGYDMPEPMTDARLAEIRDAESRNLAKLFDSTVTELLAEVARLRAALGESDQNHEKWVKFVHPELDKLRADRDRVNSEISTRCSGLTAWPCPTAIARGIGN